MRSLSVCMIVKNEEDVIGRCLQCVKGFADEIIIVDTGSTDKTKEIAAGYTNAIYDFPWTYDFGAARNFSFGKASKDYIMWLDADDVIDEENQNGIKKLMSGLEPSVDMVMMKYDVAFDENGNPTFSYYRERIMKRSKQYQWVGAIHEAIEPSGTIIHSELAVSHKKIRANEPKRNLRIFEKLLEEGKQLDPRQSYYYARELYYNDQIPTAIERFEKFLSDEKGWIENNISACKDLAVCYLKIGEDEKAFFTLVRSFVFDEPRAEICCEIGKYLLKHKRYKAAIFWYELAADRTMDCRSGGFCLTDCYGYIPYMQLCVCYDKLGEREKAIEYNERAGRIKPEDKSYLFNKQYFSSNHKL